LSSHLKGADGVDWESDCKGRDEAAKNAFNHVGGKRTLEIVAGGGLDGRMNGPITSGWDFQNSRKEKGSQKQVKQRKGGGRPSRTISPSFSKKLRREKAFYEVPREIKFLASGFSRGSRQKNRPSPATKEEEGV